MRKLLIACVLAATANLYLLAGAPGLAYLDIANVFTANQRINAGVGVNVAPGATGTLSLSDGIFEFGRSTKLGAWTNVTYSGSLFTASGAMTWTVDSGDMVTYSYSQVGKTLWVIVALTATSVGGTPDNRLFIQLPAAFTGANIAAQTVVQCRINDNGTDLSNGIAFSTTGSNLITVRIGQGASNFSASTNNTAISFVIPIPLS